MSRRTIINDIQILSASSPIYTVCGRHGGGGVYILDGCSAERKYLTDDQAKLLSRIAETLNQSDKEIIQSIVKTFSVSLKGKGKF